MIEFWTQVNGYQDYYVSNLGRVKSFKRSGERLLKLHTDSRGYKYVRLYSDKKSKHFFVHRLVANGFIENPDNKPQVNHKDGNKDNNTMDNLEWSTNSENQIHAIKLGLKDTKKNKKLGKDNKQSIPVIQLMDNKEVTEYAGIKEACRITGIPDSNITSCCKGLKTHAGGFKWMYKEEYDLLTDTEKNLLNHKVDKFLMQPILQFDKNENLVRKFRSANEAEKITEIHKQNILQCCKGNRKTAGGYIWRFDKEND